MGIWEKPVNTASPQGGAIPGWGPARATPSTVQSAPAESVSPAATTVPVDKLTAFVSRDAYWANKEARDLEKERVYREEDIPAIRRSTAYTTAAALGAAALAHDVLSFGNAAKAKRLDMYLGFVDQIADHVFAKLNGGEGTIGSEAGDEEATAEEEVSLDE